ncbi:hypothetical protein J2T17_007029 [Paenibacillus mucilaginosus]|uniref:hypothetical protein n=1 Tax=Paenibacillus mucilaginosus TaxID=61624 RepID=UPI003D203488
MYLMSREDLDKVIVDFIGAGFLEMKGDSFRMNRLLVPTEKGKRFYEEHQAWEEEMPSDPRLFAHWIRFQEEKFPLTVGTSIMEIMDRKAIDFDKLLHNLKKVYEHVRHQNGIADLQVHAPADEQKIRQVEQLLNRAIPASFRQVLLSWSSQVLFFWSLYGTASSLSLENKDTHLSHEVIIPEIGQRKISCGGYMEGIWNAEKLADYEKFRRDHLWLDTEWNHFWRDSFIFTLHGNGSCFGIYEPTGEVIYLSIHQEMHGWRVGSSFETFIYHWFGIGCAGHWGEDFLLFAEPPGSYVHSDSLNSRLVKKWLNLG